MPITELSPGSTFAGYEIEALVGRGGMGVVYRARELALDRPVALKLVAPELSEDAGFRERFLRESRLAASLEHPHILPVHAAGEADGSLYLALRYVEGEDLKAVLVREGALTPERALAIVSQIASALDGAHARGLVHRDVKPGNVLLDTSGEAYLSDFGLTKRLASESGPTQTGQLLGTLDYLAPEQIRGEPVDGRTDCYSLACVLYECLTGQVPFPRESEAQVLWAHMQEAPPAPSKARPELPAAIDAVLAKALAKDPAERYQTCSELVEAARSALGLDGRVVARRRLRRGRLLLAAGALLLAGAVAAVLSQLVGGEGSVRAPPAPPQAPPLAVERNSVAVIDPKTSKVVAQIPVGNEPTAVAFGEGALWVVNGKDRTVSQIDPKTRTLVRTFGTGSTPTDLADGLGAVWVANFDDTVAQVDPRSGSVERTIRLPQLGESPALATPARTETEEAFRSYVAVGEEAVWVSREKVHRLIWRIDPKSGAVVKTIRLRPTAPFGSAFGGPIAVGAGAVWVEAVNAVTRIDPSTNSAATIAVPLLDRPTGVAVGERAVWAIGSRFRPEGGTVWRIGPEFALEPGFVPEKQIDVDRGPTGVAVGEGSVWVVNGLTGTVSRIDPATNEVANTIEIGHVPRGIAVGGGLVWVTVS